MLFPLGPEVRPSAHIPAIRQRTAAPCVGRPAPRAISDENAGAHVLVDQSMGRRGFSRLGGRGTRIEVLRL